MRFLLITAFLLNLVNSGLVTPEQIHISWTENAHEMRVTWTSFVPLDSWVIYRPILCEDPQHNSFDFKQIQGNYTKFNEGTVTVRYAFIYTAVIKNLISDCHYEYYIQNDASLSKSYIFSGRTPESVDSFEDTDNKLNMIIFGDWGTGPIGELTSVLLGIDSKVKDFSGIIHLGDIGYNLNSDDGLIGDLYGNQIQDITASIPYMTLPGNHEDADNMTHYKIRFKMPNNDYNQGTGLFYSFNVGPVHFVMLNTEVYYREAKSDSQAEIQLEWLKQDLETANLYRKKRPWIIAMSHHPLYCSYDFTELDNTERNKCCGHEAQFLRDKLEDIFYYNAVDIFFGAHLHTYERMTAIYKNLTVQSEYDDYNTHKNPKATIHILDGNAGNHYAHNADKTKTPQEWSKFRTDDYGYGRMTFHNKTHLFFEQISDYTMNVVDSLWIIKTIERF